MEKTKIIVLDSKQMVELLHDYIATNARKICYDKSLNETGTYIILEKYNVKMLCVFSKNNENEFVYDRYELLKRLPHTGFRNFILSNEQVQELLDGKKTLTLNQIKLEKEYRYKRVPENHIRFMILNEEETVEILFKQIFEYVGNIIGFHTTEYNAGIKIIFDGDDSALIYYCGDKPLDFNLTKLSALNFSSVSSFDFKFIELTDDEVKELLD